MWIQKRFRVFFQNVPVYGTTHMLKHMCAWCRHARGRLKCTHGGVFESTHTGFFHVFSVKRTSPDTENHDKNDYAKVYDDNNIFMTNVDNDSVHQHAQHVGLSTPARCLVFVLHTDTSHPHWLKSSLSLSPSSTCHPCVVNIDSLRLLLLPLPALPRLLPSFLSMYFDDLDSVTNNLRPSLCD